MQPPQSISKSLAFAPTQRLIFHLTVVAFVARWLPFFFFFRRLNEAGGLHGGCAHATLDRRVYSVLGEVYRKCAHINTAACVLDIALKHNFIMATEFAYSCGRVVDGV